MVDCANINSQIAGNRTVRLTNCTLIDNGISGQGDLWIRNGQILDGHRTFYGEKKGPDLIIDCLGKYLCPGFIDLQINGGCGIDFTTDAAKTPANLKLLSKELIKTGVTWFCPTIVTASHETYMQVLPKIQRTNPSVEEGAGIIGAHVEGPFINPDRRGAHDPNLIRKFDHGYDTALDIYGPGIKNAEIVTLAPELQGSTEVIRRLCDDYRICVSLGHSAASLEQGEAAINAGARMVTHLFNAMLPYHHRDPHLVGLLTSDKIKRPIHFGIIADEIHTHPSALRLAWSAHPSGLVLVTDAMAAFGLGAGVYTIGNQQVQVKQDGRAVLADHPETLAGSTVTIPQCVWNLSRSAHCSLAEAIKAATRAPAEVIGRREGTLAHGSQANLVLFDVNDSGLQVCATFTQGQLAYLRPGCRLDIQQQG